MARWWVEQIVYVIFWLNSKFIILAHFHFRHSIRQPLSQGETTGKCDTYLDHSFTNKLSPLTFICTSNWLVYGNVCITGESVSLIRLDLIISYFREYSTPFYHILNQALYCQYSHYQNQQHRYSFELHRVLPHEMCLIKGRSVHMNKEGYALPVTWLAAIKAGLKLHFNQKSRFPIKYR